MLYNIANGRNVTRVVAIKESINYVKAKRIGWRLFAMINRQLFSVKREECVCIHTAQ